MICIMKYYTFPQCGTFPATLLSQPAPDFMLLYIYMFLSRSQHFKTIKEFPCLKKERKLTWETMITLGNDGFAWLWQHTMLLTTLRSCAVANWKKSSDCCWPAFSFSDHERHLFQGCSHFRHFNSICLLLSPQCLFSLITVFSLP